MRLGLQTLDILSRKQIVGTFTISDDCDYLYRSRSFLRVWMKLTLLMLWRQISAIRNSQQMTGTFLFLYGSVYFLLTEYIEIAHNFIIFRIKLRQLIQIIGILAAKQLIFSSVDRWRTILLSYTFNTLNLH